MGHIGLTIFVIGVILQVIFAKLQLQIVGGFTAHLGEFPYQVSLKIHDRHICGGSLITDRHVLTAAHCVRNVGPPYVGFNVVTGTISRSSGGQVHNVSSVVINPNYEPDRYKSFENDLAVIALTKPYKENEFQKPIPLGSDAPVGAAVTFSGWGNLGTDIPEPENLQKVILHLLSNEECQQDIRKYISISIYPGQLCTLENKGIGACYGDSGSPLVYNGTLVGVFSWLFPCAKGLPDVFTRVSHYKTFIDAAIRET